MFHRVQLRRIGRQVLGGDVTLGELDELLHQTAAVRRQPVPDDQQRLLDVACQGLQEVDDLEFPDRARVEPEVEVAEAQPGRYRKLLPVEVELQDRRLATRRPGAATMRLLS